MSLEETCISNQAFWMWAGFEEGVRARMMLGCWDGRRRGFVRIL